MIPLIEHVQNRESHGDSACINGGLGREKRECGVTAHRSRGSPWGVEDTLILVVVMGAQVCEYTKNY